jgi:hypothetical protein
MTVNSEFPYLEYVANGVTTRFTFDWSSGDPDDIYVKINGVLAKEGVEYELENWSEPDGGDIVFSTAPVAGTSILIYRDTPVTQQRSAAGIYGHSQLCRYGRPYRPLDNRWPQVRGSHRGGHSERHHAACRRFSNH